VLLAHIDCDVYASVAFAWDAVKPCMASGGYVVFDDAHVSSCLGATEAVENLPIRRDGLNCEQIWPHFVFRVWNDIEPAANSNQQASGADAAGHSPKAQRAENPTSNAAVYPARLEAVRRENALLRQQYLELADKLAEAREDIRKNNERLAEPSAQIEDVNARHGTLVHQVSMAQQSRWLRLGRLFGVGPRFDSPK
jgi:hypothetical protein